MQSDITKNPSVQVNTDASQTSIVEELANEALFQILNNASPQSGQLINYTNTIQNHTFKSSADYNNCIKKAALYLSSYDEDKYNQIKLDVKVKLEVKISLFNKVLDVINAQSSKYKIGNEDQLKMVFVNFLLINAKNLNKATIQKAMPFIGKTDIKAKIESSRLLTDVLITLLTDKQVVDLIYETELSEFHKQYINATLNIERVASTTFSPETKKAQTGSSKNTSNIGKAAEAQVSKENEIFGIEPYAIYFNNKGYDKDSTPNSKSLKLDDGTRIGYNIYVPDNRNRISYNNYIPDDQKCKKIIVHFYGGGTKEDKIQYATKELSTLDKALLKNGIMVINLNLADLFQKKPQFEMDEETLNKITKSVLFFCETLMNKPDSINKNLTKYLSPDREIYLLASSFGPRVSMRVRENAIAAEEKDSRKKPPFKGVIIHSPALGDYQNTINLPELAKDESSPVLYIAASDDNNLETGQEVLALTKKLGDQKRLGKEFQLMVVQKGGISPIDPSDQHNKGHYFPTSGESFELLLERMLDFINRGPSELSTVSERRASRIISETAGNTNIQTFESKASTRAQYDFPTFEQKFLAELITNYDGCKNDIKHDDKRLEEWLKSRERLYFAHMQVDVIPVAQQLEAFLNLDSAQRSKLTSNTIQYTWPLFRELLAEQAMDKKVLNIEYTELCDQVVKELSENYLTLLNQYAKKTNLDKKSELIVKKLLLNIYMADFTIGDSEITFNEKRPAHIPPYSELKEKFKAIIVQSEKQIDRIWQQMGTELRKKQKPEEDSKATQENSSQLWKKLIESKTSSIDAEAKTKFAEKIGSEQIAKEILRK